MSKMKILYAASEIAPFLETSSVGSQVRNLAQYVQEQEAEIRVLVPRFGMINERRNRIHEVVRLSGVNVKVGNQEKSLIVKVGTIPHVKIQVYFIDNDDYFKRKQSFQDKEGFFFEDNDERMIFFCRGVLEAVKRLEWQPDIIHCHDWLSSLVPVYLQALYRDVPLFEKAKLVFTLYNNIFPSTLGGALAERITAEGIKSKATSVLASGGEEALFAASIQYVDAVVRAEEIPGATTARVREASCIADSEEGREKYYALYQSLIN